MNHYPHHIGDYAKDTMGLSQGEHGAYRLLMDAAYATETAIPKEDVYAIGKAANAEQRRNVDRVLAKYFKLEDDGYHQKRIDEEVSIYQAKAEKNRRNGKTGGRPKINPQETQTVSETEPNTNPKITLANSQEPITKEKTKTRAPAFVRPGWIEASLWDDFLAMRVRIKRAATDRAQALIVRELERLKAQGHDPSAVLEQSIKNSWQDVYPLKSKASGSSGLPAYS